MTTSLVPALHSTFAEGVTSSAVWHSTLGALDDDGGAVTEHLGHTIENLGCIVADADDGIGSGLLGMREHLVEGVRARPLAEIGEERDVAADERLQRTAD